MAAKKNDFGLVKNGEMTPAVNQAAATVLANSESDLSCAGFNFSTNPNITLLKLFVKKIFQLKMPRQ